MHSLHDLGDVLIRAVYLLALAVAPPLLAPEPAPASSQLVAGAVALVTLAILAYSAARLRARLAGTDARLASALIQLAIVGAAGAALFYRGDRAPLARGLVFVAVPMWAGLTAAAGAVAERRLGSDFRHKRLLATVLTVCTGVSLYAASARWLVSPEKMWWETLLRDGDTERATTELTRTSIQARKYDAARGLADTCLAARPSSCACLGLRARVGVAARTADKALEDARIAAKICPTSSSARATLAEALVMKGDAEAAEQEARAGLAVEDTARLHYALALALDHSGRRDEAIVEARRAVEQGAGRDAALTVGALCITANDLDCATKALQPIVAADPNDADAQYDLALVADKKNDYNHARQGYLAALRADPQLANARYNLVYLTARQGVLDEARHHLAKFQQAYPGDPRAADLARMLAAAGKR